MPFGHFFRKKTKRIYLDYAAATPVREEVHEVMEPYFSEIYGNPSAIHAEGQQAKNALENARLRVARTLKVRPEGVFFTGSGTESNNLALYGAVRRLEDSNRALSDIAIISTKIEHPSILAVLEDLSARGVDVRYAELDSDGRIDTKHLQTLLSPEVALVTFAYANSEIGVVQDVKHIARLVKKYNMAEGANILVHLDAAQAPLWLPCQMDMLGVDMLSLDAGKCYGPKGVGVLAVRHGVRLRGILLGGGQESGMRAGTENVPLIVGAAEALYLAQDEWEKVSEAASKLRDAFIELLTTSIEGVVLNGSSEHRIANNVNISIPGIDSEYAVVTLDAKGIAASTKSACSGASGNGSSVVRAVTGDDERATSTIRFSLGKETTRADIAAATEILTEHVAAMRAFTKTLT